MQLTQPAKRLKSALDITSIYYQELVRDIDIRSFDTFPKLKTFLSSPLPVKYPTMEENLSETFSEVFEYSTDKIVVPSAFENATTQHFNFSDAENANITLWDMLIRIPIENMAGILKLFIQVGRNQEDKSTTLKAKKPDFLLWMNNILVLKGEEKGSASDFEMARQELVEKMKKIHVTIFGSLPFLFAYAAANARVQFFAIDRSLNFEEISTEFDLRKLEELIQCVVFSLKICRILFHYKPLLPTGFTPMYQKIPRNNGTITLYEDYILKKLERPPYDLDAVNRISDAIEEGLIECTIRCNVRRNLTFQLAPVGYTIKPASDGEFIAALVCVARALVGLHAQGFVHRDIRWPNVLCLGNRSFILIDFESVGRVGDSIPEELLCSRMLDPLGLVSDVKHEYYHWHDMYQVGGLIDVLHFHNPPLLELWKNLQNPNAEQRFTAEQTLNYLLDL